MGERKYFLDWLRVLAFAALICFHVGMLYVTWGYNLKSPRIYPQVEWVMEATSAWRMPLLFVISGVACRYLIVKLGPGHFALNRLARLGAVVLTAMLLVNPVQVWIQLVSQGATTQHYFEFWFTSYLTSDLELIRALHRPMPTWDHLWFVVYLIPYSLLFAGVSALLSKRRRFTLPLWALLLLPAVWMSLTNGVIAIKAPITHALINDWGAHLKWIGLFGIGAIAATRDDFWSLLRRHRLQFALVALLLLAIYLTCRVPWLQNPSSLNWTLCYRIAEGAYGGMAVFAIAGFAAQLLNRSSSTLRYLNEAVLPVYVLHQPAMLIAAFLLFPWQLPIVIEVAAITLVTALVPLFVHHVAIKPWRAMRILFGLKSVRA